MDMKFETLNTLALENTKKVVEACDVTNKAVVEIYTNQLNVFTSLLNDSTKFFTTVTEQKTLEGVANAQVEAGKKVGGVINKLAADNLSVVTNLQKKVFKAA